MQDKNTWFIDKANNIHNGKYDYSLVQYKGYEIPVEIICTVHGKFLQKPKAHLYGKRGCIKCARCDHKLSLDSFLEKANIIHSNKYDYSLINFSGNKSSIKIKCYKHGFFSQRVNSHLRGAGCPECGGVKRITLDSFLQKAKNIHGDRYDYSLVEIKNNTTNIKIICKTHGEFLQTPKSHLKGSNCIKCADKLNGISRRKTLEQFIIDAKYVHGDKYDYSLVDYQTTMKKIKIICKIHGIFEQRPENHIHMKQGCSKCFHENNKPVGGYSIELFETQPELKQVPAILYLAKISNKKDYFYKIGITKLDLKMRFYYKKPKTMQIIPIIEQKTTLFDAFTQEQHLIDALKSHQYFPNNKFSGFTECFKVNDAVESYFNNYFKINIT